MQNILLKRHGKWLEVGIYGPNGQMAPMPYDLQQAILNRLSYSYSFCPREGGNIIGPPQQEIRALGMMTPQGTVITGIGCLPRLANKEIPELGGKAWWQDVTPPLPRPNCFVVDWETVRAKFQFRPKQEECLQRIVEAVQRGDGVGGLIDATVGFGKTALFKMLALLFPYAKIAITVAGAEIIPRIVKDLMTVTPSVGQVTGKKKYKGRVTVYTADSLHHCDNDIDIMLVDECHEIVTESRAAKLSHLRHATTFMFSASMDDRMDGLQARLEPMAGPTIFTLPYPEAVALGLVVPMRVMWVPIDMYENPAAGLSGVKRSRKGIWRNTVRNHKIADFMRNTFQRDEQQLISVNTLDHAIHLQSIMPEFQLAYAGADLKKIAKYKAWGLLPPDFVPMSGEDRGRLRDSFSRGDTRKVIATTVWSRGVSFDQLTVMFRGDGGASAIKDLQWPGRASRLFDGKVESVIGDCIDSFDPRLMAHSRTRKKNYDEHGWTQDGWIRKRGELVQP